MPNIRKSNRIVSDKPNVSIVIIFIVVFLCCWITGFSVEDSKGFAHHIMFAFFHANIFHLLANCLCVMQLRNIKGYLLEAYIISFVCSYMPQLSPLWSLGIISSCGIIGASGILFAIVGMKYAQVSSFSRMVSATAPFIIVSALLPNIAWTFHVQCLIVGFLSYHIKGYIYDLERNRKRDR